MTADTNGNNKILVSPQRLEMIKTAILVGRRLAWPEWWRELAPLTRQERGFVRAQKDAL